MPNLQRDAIEMAKDVIQQAEDNPSGGTETPTQNPNPQETETTGANSSSEGNETSKPASKPEGA